MTRSSGLREQTAFATSADRQGTVGPCHLPDVLAMEVLAILENLQPHGKNAAITGVDDGNWYEGHN